MEASELLFQQRLNENQQDWEEQLKYVNQQSKDGTQKLEEMVSNHSTIHNEQENLQNSLSKLSNRLDGLELTVTHIGSGSAPDKAVDVDAIIQEAQTQVESLAQVYENGEPIDFIEIDNPTPSQKALTILNWIARTIREVEKRTRTVWNREPRPYSNAGTLLDQAIKDKLKEVRGVAPPLPEPLNPDTDVSTDAAYNEIQK